MDLQPVIAPPGFRTGGDTSTSTEEYFLNMGPQHPSTHGVLRLVLKLDGESIIEVVPHLGYIHRGLEKVAENQTYVQNIHLSDRVDYLSSHIYNMAYCLTVENALGIGVPERAEYIRVIVCELQRIQSHLLWWGVMGMDLGAITCFLYGFKEREIITDIFEELCGARLTMNYFRPGGSFADVPDSFIPQVKSLIEKMKVALDEYNTLLTGNIIFQKRTKGVGVLTAEDAIQYGCSGPVLRGSGVSYDVRKDDTYSIYDQFDFDVPLGTKGDCFDRYVIRMEEMAQSLKILEQAVAKFPTGPYRSKTSASIKLQPGTYYSQVETGRGLLGIYIVSKGGTKPYRIKYRSPSMSNLHALNHMAQGHKIADLIPIVATMDIVIPDIDR
ncbi:MAG: NADH-quinone oxidoreductase subunit D [Desulfobulbaceae bacterium]|nr:NADH-quinone oxidoreductase subunit D [Desulfobulbaceae bacterium]